MKRGLPRARRDLLTSDHSRRGRRCVTVLDPATLTVSVLEPWEHAVLVLCDGTRGAREISALLGEVEGVGADLRDVQSALEFFGRAGIVEFETSSRRPRFASARPQSIAALQSAYAEWHTDPLRTSQILKAQSGTPFETDPLDERPAAAVQGRVEDEATAQGERLQGVVALGRSVFSAPLDPWSEGEGEEVPEEASFADEPTLERAPPRAETELMTSAPKSTSAPRAGRRPPSAEPGSIEPRTVPMRAAPRARPATPEGRARCPLCLAEVTVGASICPACGVTL